MRFRGTDIHILFSRSSADRHLGRFHVGAVMNNAMKFALKFLCRHLFSVLLGIDLGMELLDHMATMWNCFEELSDWFP